MRGSACGGSSGSWLAVRSSLAAGVLIWRAYFSPVHLWAALGFVTTTTPGHRYEAAMAAVKGKVPTGL